MRASAERCVRVLGTTMAMENPSREPHIVQVRGDFRIDVYERPVQLTLGSLSLEAQRELLVYQQLERYLETITGETQLEKLLEVAARGESVSDFQAAMREE